MTCNSSSSTTAWRVEQLETRFLSLLCLSSLQILSLKKWMSFKEAGEKKSGKGYRKADRGWKSHIGTGIAARASSQEQKPEFHLQIYAHLILDGDGFLLFNFHPVCGSAHQTFSPSCSHNSEPIPSLLNFFHQELCDRLSYLNSYQESPVHPIAVNALPSFGFCQSITNH